MLGQLSLKELAFIVMLKHQSCFVRVTNSNLEHRCMQDYNGKGILHAKRDIEPHVRGITQWLGLVGRDRKDHLVPSSLP